MPLVVDTTQTAGNSMPNGPVRAVEGEEGAEIQADGGEEAALADIMPTLGQSGSFSAPDSSSKSSASAPSQAAASADASGASGSGFSFSGFLNNRSTNTSSTSSSTTRSSGGTTTATTTKRSGSATTTTTTRPSSTTTTTTTTRPNTTTTTTTTQLQNTTTPEFQTASQVAAYYNQAVKNTKAKGTLRGSDKMEADAVDIDNLPNIMNNTIKNMITSLMNQVMKPTTNKSLPFGSQQIDLLASDIQVFSVKDNGSTYTIKIYPKAESGYQGWGKGPQSRFFEIWDLKDTYEEMGVQFAQGADKGASVRYEGGYGEITIQKSTQVITKATYELHIKSTLTDASIVNMI